MRSEVGRVLNRVVELLKRATLPLEWLNFSHPDPSHRLNRILQNCGHSAIKANLAELEQRLGVTSEEGNPAYKSQTCAVCGNVDRRNRKSQARFACCWCGKKLHADVNGSRNLEERRPLPIGLV